MKKTPFSISVCVAGMAFSVQTLDAATLSDPGSGIEGSGIAVTADSINHTPDSVSTRMKTLDEVVVEADRVIKRGNTTLLFPSKRDKRFAAGGLDVLANINIPEITVNPISQNVTTSGGENVAMFIDFLPASAQQLREIRPQDIERIDIIHSPDDPRFNNAQVVANYIMKKYLYGGYTKADGTQMFMPYYGNYGLYSKFSYKRMTYDLSTGINYSRYGNESRNESSSEYRFASGTLERESYTESFKSRQLRPRVSARAVYNAKGISIANSAGFNYLRSKPWEKASIVDFSDIFDSSQSFASSNSTSKGAVWNGDYWFALPSNSSLSFNGSFSWSENHNNSAYTLAGYAPIVNDISENAINTYGSLNYTKRIGQHSVSGFASGGWSRNRLDYLSSDATGVYYREGYGQIGAGSNLSFDRFMISPSVRASLSSQRINDRTFTKLYPKAFLRFYFQIANAQSINGSFEFAKGGPDASFLSPVLLRSNEVDAIRGNENLGDYDFYNARIGYSYYFGPWLRARLDVNFNYENDILVPVYREALSESGTPMMVRDIINDGSEANTRIGLNLSGEYFQRRLTVGLSAGARYYARRGIASRDKWEPDFWASASYYIGNFRINAYFTPARKTFSAWYDTKTPYYLYIGGSWSWKDLFIDVQFSNPFRKSYIDCWTDYSSDIYSNHTVSHSPGYHQLAKVTVSYSFGYGKKVDRRDEVGTLQDAQSIMLK